MLHIEVSMNLKVNYKYEKFMNLLALIVTMLSRQHFLQLEVLILEAA
jgi:hypothetical protein